MTPSLLGWVELGLERQQQGVGRSWNVPERSGSDATEMLSHGFGERIFCRQSGEE